ncbi:MAG: hypothetical protein DBX59_07970 [Bacillota bacterium]|nr:MAG: hypothetical protein DBX59_07970 [Bacillota bacterium]
MKKLSLLVALTVLVSGFSLLFGACNDANKTASAESYVALDINPSVEFVLDKHEKVISVRALNKDAEILLYGADGIVGAKIGDASEKVAELAVQYGYLSEENASIGVTVSGKTTNAEGKILSKIDAGLQASCGKVGLKIEIVTDGGYVLNGKLAKLKEQYPANADIQALTAGKYRLVLAAMKVDRSLTVEAAAAMSAEDLSEILYESEKYRLEIASERFEDAYEKLELAYEQNKDVLLDNAYLVLANNGLDKAAKAAEYIALRNAYRAVEYIDEINFETEPVLTDEQLAQIAETIGKNAEEFIAGVKAYGAATEDAVEYYLESLYRNMSEEDQDRFEEVFDAAEDLLEEIEEALEEISAEALNTVKAALAPIAEFIRIEIDKINEYDDLDDYVLDKIEDRIEEIEEWFEENLSDEEKKEVADAKAAVQEKIEELRAEFEKEIADLKAEVENELKELQQARIDAAA